MGTPGGVSYEIASGTDGVNNTTSADSISMARSDFKAMETAISAYDLLIKSGKKVICLNSMPLRATSLTTIRPLALVQMLTWLVCSCHGIF